MLVNSIAKNTKVADSNSDCKNKTVKRLLLSKNSNKTLGYSISNTRLAFIKLRYAFTKALIFQHFDLKSYI